MSFELLSKVVVVISALALLVSLVKFVSNFSVMDHERWSELGKPYFSDGGQNIYLKEIKIYYKTGKVNTLKNHSKIFSISGPVTLIAIIVGSFSQYSGI